MKILPSSLVFVLFLTAACQPSEGKNRHSEPFFKERETSCVDAQKETIKEWGLAENDGIEALVNYIFDEQKKPFISPCPE